MSRKFVARITQEKMKHNNHLQKKKKKKYISQNNLQLYTGYKSVYRYILPSSYIISKHIH